MPHEPAAYIRTILTDGDYSGVAEEPYVADYPDPYDLLSLYTANFANWSDPEFDRMLTAATSIADPALRMEKLAECETTLLRAMPFVPLYFDTWVYLERPEVHGLSPGPMGYPAFKYAWIDSEREGPMTPCALLRSRRELFLASAAGAALRRRVRQAARALPGG